MWWAQSYTIDYLDFLNFEGGNSFDFDELLKNKFHQGSLYYHNSQAKYVVEYFDEIQISHNIIKPSLLTKEILKFDNISAEVSTHVSSQFASVNNPVRILMPYEGMEKVSQLDSSGVSHRGQYAFDFALAKQTPVLSVAPGIVISVVSVQDRHIKYVEGQAIYPNFVTILHNAGTSSQFYASYLHMEPEGLYKDQHDVEYYGKGIRVQIGDVVEAGTVLGYNGSSGSTLGVNPDHLHLEFGSSLIVAPVNTAENGRHLGLVVAPGSLEVGSIQFETPIRAGVGLISSNIATTESLGKVIVSNPDDEVLDFYHGEYLVGTSGGDIFLGGPGVDDYDGRDGEDTILLNERSGVDWAIRLAGDNGIIRNATTDPNGEFLENFTNIEIFELGDGNDLVDIIAGDIELFGGAGDDTLFLQGRLDDYAIESTQSGVLEISSIDVSAIVHDFEIFQFSNGDTYSISFMTSLDTGQPAAFITKVGKQSRITEKLSTIDLGTSARVTQKTEVCLIEFDDPDVEASDNIVEVLIDGIRDLFSRSSSQSSSVLSQRNSELAATDAFELQVNQRGANDAVIKTTRLVVDGVNPDIVSIVPDTDSTGSLGSSGFDYGNAFSQAYSTTADFSYEFNSVGANGDPYDVLKFSTERDGDWSLSLTNLTTNLGVILYDSNFKILTAGSSSGLSDENLSHSLDANETYYVSIYSDSGLSGQYALDMDFSPDLPDETPPDEDDVVPDLIVRKTEIEVTEIFPEDNLVVEWEIKNIGSGDATRSYSGIYLSVDDNVTTDDRLIADENTVRTILAGGRDEESQIVDLPDDIDPGTYYVAVIANHDDLLDEDDSNNVGEVIRIKVRGEGADYTLSSFEIDSDDNLVRPGEELDMSWTVNNIGDERGRSVLTAVYLSSDDVLSDDDMELGVDRTSRFELGDTGRGHLDYVIPEDMEPGDYTLFAVTNYDDDDPEVTDSNNTASLNFTLLPSLVPGIDLTPGFVSVPNEINVDTIIDFTWSLENLGDQRASSSPVNFYLSRDDVLSEDDYHLRSDSAGSMSAGEYHTETDDRRIPREWDDGTDIFSGDYYIIAIVDEDETIDDVDRGNNATATPVRVLGRDADGQITDFDIQRTTIESGDYLRLNFDTANVSDFDTESSRFQVGVYLSADEDVTTDDIRLDLISTTVNFRHETRTSDVVVFIPEYLTPGTYHIAAIVDPDGNEFELYEDNNVSDSLELTITEATNLSYQRDVDVSLQDAAFVANHGPDNLGRDFITFDLDLKIDNSGNSLFPDARWELFQSVSLNLPEGLARTFGGRMGPLETGENYTFSEVMAVNRELSHFYSINLFIRADSEERVDETSETNNLTEAFTLVINPTTDEADNIFLSQSELLVRARGGDDTITGSEWDDYVNGGEGHDTFHMGGGDDAVWGEDGHDVMFGGDDSDELYGGTGNDFLDGGPDNDLLDGGSGTDRASYLSATSRVIVNLGLATAQDTQSAGVDTLIDIEQLEGSDFGDILYGNSGSNYVLGGAGNDYIDGGASGDVLDGGAGVSDWVSFQSATSRVVVDLSLTGLQDTQGAGVDLIRNFENLEGSDFGDILFGDAGNNYIDGQVGNDYIRGGLGNDTLVGGAGVGDWVSYLGASGGVIVDIANTTAQDTGADGIDRLSGFENLEGSDHRDILYGDAGDNYIDGRDGSDYIRGGLGNDTLVGGDGASDWVSYLGSSERVVVDLSITGAQNTIGEDTDRLSGFENLEGSNFNDRLTGDLGNNFIDGRDGNDVIEGGAGDDILVGGAGIDRVIYASATSRVVVNLSLSGAQNTQGGGVDRLTGFEQVLGSDFGDILFGTSGGNYLLGGAGNDYIDGGAGGDVLDGGEGVSDWVSFQSETTGVIVDLSLSGVQATQDIIRNFENLEGSDFNDQLTGDGGDNYIDGQDGNDVIDGGAGNDILVGGAGADRVSYQSATSRVIVDLGITGAQDTRGGGVDRLSGFEQVEGSDFGDILFGSSGNNYVLGGAGNDYIDGGASGDVLDGGAGSSDWVSFQSEARGVTVDLSLTGVQATNDIIRNFENLEGSDFNDNLSGDSGDNYIDGQEGHDVINGGAGNDRLNGGAGGDLFVFDASFGADRILDFQDGADQLQFRIAGLTQFSQLTVMQDGVDTVISYNGNSVRLTGITSTDITGADVAFAAPVSQEKIEAVDIVFEPDTSDSFEFKKDADSRPIAEVMDNEVLLDATGTFQSQLQALAYDAHVAEPLTFIDANGNLAIITSDEDGYWDMVG